MNVSHGLKIGPISFNTVIKSILVTKEGHVTIEHEKSLITVLGIKLFSGKKEEII
jgi:hypothetical protein